ncbi:MAG: helix-turn-helix domain-containing protein [Erysipelotrichaceae bacterium]|nr:helix-turn-helix domain-containing protein [Erysipelotrichaceae bacterium]
MDIGNNLKELRESNHCTINELSLSINISEETIISWENNENEPSVEEVLLLNEFYLSKAKKTNITTQHLPILFIISIICIMRNRFSSLALSRNELETIPFYYA